MINIKCNELAFGVHDVENVGIKILRYSSDIGLLKAMQMSSNFTQFYLQDIVHIGTKLRTRILKPGVILPIGNFMTATTHLNILIGTYFKYHLLNKMF